jgi:hypothetical protein
MSPRLGMSGLRAAVIAGAVALACAPAPGRAQPPACPPPVLYPAAPYLIPGARLPAGAPTAPGQSQQPQQGLTAPDAAPPSLAGGLSAAVGGESVALSNVGYIDSAIPMSQFRLRYDTAYGSNRPTRAEFFWPRGGVPGTPGPLLPETNVDYQELTAYAEGCVAPWLSVFAEAPVRFVNPAVNDNTAGFSDMNFGFKFAAIGGPDSMVSFQFRTYVPTGDGDRGLGTHHVSLEPGLLLYHRFSDRLTLEGEFRDWIPVGGTDFAGNILRYGVGLGYRVPVGCTVSVTPVTEFVGWTALGGKEQPAAVIEDAAGDTIVNAKVGVRVGFNDPCDGGLLGRSDLYVGYGRALTGEVWYKDTLRVELRMRY